MKTFEKTLDPRTDYSIRIKLFSNVKNVADIRKKIIGGELKCCVINPSLIVDPLQIVIAANKAVVLEKFGKIITKSIYTEILFNLSISKNLTRSLQQFGIDDKYSDLLVAVLCKDGENTDEIFKNIEGEERDIEELKDLTDVKAVKKAYAITAEDENEESLLYNIINKMVIKDFS